MFNKTAFNHVLALVWMGQDVLFMTGTTLDTLCCFKSGVTDSVETAIWIFLSLSQWSLAPNIFHSLLHVHLLMLFVNCPLWKNFNFSFIQLIKILSDCLHTENYLYLRRAFFYWHLFLLWQPTTTDWSVMLN